MAKSYLVTWVQMDRMNGQVLNIRSTFRPFADFAGHRAAELKKIARRQMIENSSGIRWMVSVTIKNGMEITEYV
jgi:hypothetical protein